MAGRSFEIATARDFYNKLLEDYAAFNEDPTSSRLAINCAMTAWHLSDWIYYDYQSTLITLFPKIRLYQEFLSIQHCTDLEIMRCITNGSKHCAPHNGKQMVQGTGIHKGVFAKQFSRQHDISYLKVMLVDGSEARFEDVLERVIAFWRTYTISQFGWTFN
jgi:hypothetical protein